METWSLTAEELTESGDLATTIRRWRSSGAPRHAALRFHLAASLLQRAQGKPPALALALEQRARQALRAWIEETEAIHRRSAALAEHGAAEHPESRQLLQGLVAEGEYRTLKRQLLCLTEGGKRGKLAALRVMEGRQASSQGASANAPANASTNAMDSATADASANSSLSSRMGTDAPTSSDPAFQASGDDSAAIRLFRESLQKLHSDRTVRTALSQCPQDPGPLNPQMLVSRSLAMLRELSPAYVNRFVAYVDTLLWLEDAGASTKADSRNKVGVQNAAEGGNTVGGQNAPKEPCTPEDFSKVDDQNRPEAGNRVEVRSKSNRQSRSTSPTPRRRG